jgi:hypothetical protein
MYFTSARTILLLGHSFVRRLAHFDLRAAPNFHLPESGNVSLLGTGGRTVDKVLKYDLSWVKKYKPDIVILEMGTNDLLGHTPEVVGSKLDDLVHVLRDQYKVGSAILRVCESASCESASCEFASCESASCESASCESASLRWGFIASKTLTYV